MNRNKKGKTNILSYVLHIGTNQGKPAGCNLAGRFDEEGNYVDDTGSSWPYKILLRPWEWVVIPEFVELANQQGVEIPVDPPIDMSKTF